MMLLRMRVILVCIFWLAGCVLSEIAVPPNGFSPSRPQITTTPAKLLRLDCSIPRSMTSEWQSLDRLELHFKQRGCSDRVSLAVATPASESEPPRPTNLPLIARVERQTNCTKYPFDCRLQVLSPFPSNFVRHGAYYCVLVYTKSTGSASAEFGVNIDEAFMETSGSETDHVLTVTAVDVHKVVLAWNQSDWEGLTEASIVRVTVDSEGRLKERPRSLLRVAGMDSLVYGGVGVLLTKSTPIRIPDSVAATYAASEPSSTRRRRHADTSFASELTESSSARRLDRDARASRSRRLAELDDEINSRSMDTLTQSLYVLRKDDCQDKCISDCYVCKHLFSCELNHPQCIGKDSKFCFCHDETNSDLLWPSSAAADDETDLRREVTARETLGGEDNWSAARPLAVMMVFFLLVLVVCMLMCVLHKFGLLCGNKYAKEFLCCPGGGDEQGHAHRQRDDRDFGSSDLDGRRRRSAAESPGEEGRSFLPSSSD